MLIENGSNLKAGNTSINLVILLKPNKWSLHQTSWFDLISTFDNTGTAVAASLDPEVAAGEEHLDLQSTLLKTNRHN